MKSNQVRGRKRAWLRPAIAAAALIIVVIGLGTLAYQAAKPSMTIGEVKRDIRASLPPASSVEEINAYLDRQGLAHNDHPEPANLSLAANLAPDVEPIQLVIEATAGSKTKWRWLLDYVELEIYFVLDEQSRLEDVVFVEISGFLS
jgi:hypothetical protein